jgi:RNA polymerase sigma-32 factor
VRSEQSLGNSSVSSLKSTASEGIPDPARDADPDSDRDEVLETCRDAEIESRRDADLESRHDADSESGSDADLGSQRDSRRGRGSALVPSSAGADRSIGRVDALSAYMTQLARYAPISREEEYALAVRWVEDRDEDAARQLVLANLRLVVKIAMEYRRAWSNVLDLIQSGNVGLLEAVQRFDPYQGVKLTSYAAYWIRAFILKYIMDNFRTVRLGRSRAQRKLFFRLNKEKRRLELEGFEAEPKLLAERLEVTEDDVIDMEQRMSQGDLSLNAPARRDEPGAEFGDFVAIEGASAEQAVADTELKRVFQQKIQEFAERLDARDRIILEQRITAEEQKTLQELADQFGVSRERVRQLEKRLVDQLREYLKANLVDFEYYAPDASE